MAEPDGFLSRWSQRKTAVTKGKALTEPAPGAALQPQPPDSVEQRLETATTAPNASAPPNAPAPAPTLDDVARLGKESDFSRFAARDVAPDVRNAAMKKLFADPHFNIMDGLDVYIDDYSKAESIPKAMLRQMVQARSLGLLDDDLVDQDLPDSPQAVPEGKTPDTSGMAVETPTPPASSTAMIPAPMDPTLVPELVPQLLPQPHLTPVPHEDPALQLQPNHAAGHEGPGGGLGDGPGDDPGIASGHGQPGRSG